VVVSREHHQPKKAEKKSVAKTEKPATSLLKFLKIYIYIFSHFKVANDLKSSLKGIFNRAASQ
jgi:hypothetical protein